MSEFIACKKVHNENFYLIFFNQISSFFGNTIFTVLSNFFKTLSLVIFRVINEVVLLESILAKMSSLTIFKAKSYI